MSETLLERIRRERAELHLAPWQLAPSEIDDGASPWPVGSAGHASWQQATEWRRQIRVERPDYFADDEDA